MVIAEDCRHAHSDASEGEASASPRCDAGGAVVVARYHPGERTKHTAAIHRERRQHVENAENGVHQGEPNEHVVDRPVVLGAEREPDAEEPEAQCETGERTGGGHEQLVQRLRCFAGNLRDSAEDEQRDAPDRDLVGARYEAVGKLVDDYRGEKEDHAGSGHRVVSPATGFFERIGVELSREQPRRQAEENEPARADKDRDSSQRPNAERSQVHAIYLTSGPVKGALRNALAWILAGRRPRRRFVILDDGLPAKIKVEQSDEDRYQECRVPALDEAPHPSNCHEQQCDDVNEERTPTETEWHHSWLLVGPSYSASSAASKPSNREKRVRVAASRWSLVLSR